MSSLHIITIFSTLTAIAFFIAWVLAVRKIDKTEQQLSNERFARAVAETAAREWEAKYRELKTREGI